MCSFPRASCCGLLAVGEVTAQHFLRDTHVNPSPIPTFHKTNRRDPPNAPPDAANDKTRSRSGFDCYSWFPTHARNNNLLDASFTHGTRMRTKTQTDSSHRSAFNARTTAAGDGPSTRQHMIAVINMMLSVQNTQLSIHKSRRDTSGPAMTTTKTNKRCANGQQHYHLYNVSRQIGGRTDDASLLIRTPACCRSCLMRCQTPARRTSGS